MTVDELISHYNKTHVELKEAQYELMDIESDLINKLVDQGETRALKINWSMLRKINDKTIK